MSIKISGVECINDDKRFLNNEDRPAIQPTLNLDFAKTKALDPRIDFTRSSTATYYDGKTFAKAEENLRTYSQDFATGWSLNGSTISSNATTAPDGTTTADLLTAGSGLTYVNVSGGGIPALTGDVFTASVYAKANTENYAYINLQRSGQAFEECTVNLTTGAISNINGSPQSTSAVDVGNGWWRISIVTNPGSSNTTLTYYMGMTGSSTSIAYSPTSSSGTESIYLWGAQIEKRGSVTAYTPTTSQPTTNYIPVLKTAASGEARFDHDPVSGESKGLLIEEQRTNLLTYSEDFDNVYWDKFDASIDDNVIAAPDGTISGEKLIEGIGTVNPRIAVNFGSPSAGTYTWSCYAKAGERSWAMINAYNNVTKKTWFNLSNGTIGTNASGSTANITPVGNGWYRLSVTRTISSTTTLFVIEQGIADGVSSYTGDGYSGIYIWGAQFEEGAFPTSYIPTSGSQVTRSADAASMTGTNFSDWYRQDEGSLYSEFSVYKSSGSFSTTWQLGSNSTDRIWQANITSGVIALRAKINDDQQVNMGSVIQSDGSYLKTVSAYATNDYALIIGDTAHYDTSSTVPYVDVLQIGTSGSDAINGHMKKLAYYPTRLTNAQLQALTEE